MASQSTTGTAVWAGVALPDTATTLTPTKKIGAINAAIRAAWPSIKRTEYAATAGTLASGTFVYSLSALSPAPSQWMGVSKVFIQEEGATTAPEVSHHVQQYYEASADAWSLKFAPSIASGYTGKVFNVAYHYPHADITVLGDTVFLPFDYLEAYCRWWASNVLYGQQTEKSIIWRDQVDMARRDYEESLKRNQTPNMQSAVRIVPQRLA